MYKSIEKGSLKDQSDTELFTFTDQAENILHREINQKLQDFSETEFIKEAKKATKIEKAIVDTKSKMLADKYT